MTILKESPSLNTSKQLLLDCILQDPKREWLHYLDERQAFRVCLLLAQDGARRGRI